MDKEMKEKERQENLRIMKDQLSWRQPILAMKKICSDRGEKDQFGFLVANGKPILYLRNIWDLSELGIFSIKDIEEKIPSKEYSSFESILDDDWEID